jgi:mannose-6-phosphate isomerase-like protein (cupin superfamily)
VNNCPVPHAEGEAYCEKVITIRPWQILSLQSHALRREAWTVKKGRLTVLSGGRRMSLSPHETIHIPAGSIRCMANMNADDCVVEIPCLDKIVTSLPSILPHRIIDEGLP